MIRAAHRAAVAASSPPVPVTRHRPLITLELRRQAAGAIPVAAYRQVASRQIYEAVRSLPDGQYQSVEAVERVVRRCVRCHPQHGAAFSVAELESLGRYLATRRRAPPWKTDAFRAPC